MKPEEKTTRVHGSAQEPAEGTVKRRSAIVLNTKIKNVVEDLEMEARLEKISPEKLIEFNGGKLLRCWKCGSKLLDLRAGSHVCAGETGL